ncbi:hypothetical protein AB1E18_014993 [Capra hircus]
MWLPSALLLLCLPGCLSLTGPGSVAGTTGSSLRVRCQYEKAYKGHNKYWCRGKYGRVCRKIVETKGEEKEKRNGRVSIRDHTDNLTFTVTMENLNMNDAGSYWCRIQTIWILDVLSWDPSVQVEVSVFPAPSTTPGSTACLAVPDTLQTVNDGQNLSTKEMLTHCPGSRLSNIHFLLLVFLKLPLFLGMVGAVLWVNRPQRHPGGRERQLDPGTKPSSLPPRLPQTPAQPRCSTQQAPKQGHLHEGQEHHADVAEEDAYEAQVTGVLEGTESSLGLRMGGKTTFLLPALFLLIIPGSSAISGPRAVRGVEQGSLTVRCQYDRGYEPYVKWWCRGAGWSSCRFVVKTNNGSEKEVKQGRVSIRDNWKDLSFTVTMEKLRVDDSDTYWCGIERVGADLGDDVDVTIDPAVSISTRATSSANMFTAPLVPEGHLPLLGSVHFLLLVFLKVPLFLGMLGAVLWVNRPLRSSGGKPQENQQPPCSSTFQEQKTLKQKEKAFFSGIDSRQWRLWFLRHRGSPLQELVP